MRVLVEEIGPDGKRIQAPVDLAALLKEERTGFEARGEAEVRLTLQRRGRQVLVEGRLEAAAACDCRRCLVPVELELPIEFRINLRPARPGELPGLPGEDPGEVGEGESAGSFLLADADEDVYQGDEIDLWPLVREQILLALPDYVQCREDCKGLCMVCGANLNEGECGCDRAVPDPRLARLKDIKL